MKKKFFYMKDKIKSKKERKSRKEEKINLNEILKDESYRLGTFRRNGRGFGFVNVGEEDEIFISPKLTKNALDGDEVLIRIFDDSEVQDGKHKREGKILQITKHSQDTIVGIYKKSRNFGFVIPDDQAVSGDIYIPKKKSANAKNNQKVVVKIDKYSDGANKAEGTIVEIIGGIDEAGVDMMSLIKEYKLPNEFPENVLAEARAIPQVIDEKNIEKRVDLRNEEIFTIDGEDAKDLDDADVQQIFELGFPNDPELVKKCFNKKNSIVLIAAPTGEGKTTTLYSIIDFLNKPEINVTTIEDPVEIRIPGLNQIEVDARATFSDSLRTVLRQDPDIILVGEIRDRETAEIAMQAGQTGHYVLSTIHTIDSIEVITRLRKIGVSDYDIASTLATSLSQRLVRRVCPKCAVKREYTEEEKNIINGIAKKYGVEYDFTGKYTYDTVGCQYCNNSGFYGRIGIFEILNMTEDVKELVIKGESSLEIRKKAMEEGYKPLVIDGFNKILNGYTTLKELNSKLVIY